MIESDGLLLHITEDEKFIDYVIDVFESVYPNRNVYFVALKENEDDLKLVHSKHPNIVKGSIDSDEFKDLIKSINRFKGVIIHNLITEFKQEVILDASPDIYFHWMAWGADLYSIPVLSRNVILAETQKFLNSCRSHKERLAGDMYNNYPAIFNLLYPFFYAEKSPLLIRMRCYRKIRSVSTVTPIEYSYVKKYISDKIKYLPFKYITIDQFYSENETDVCTDNNFLIGNSATYENNHIDTFLLLQRCNLEDKLLYCPLSYGDKKYREFVVSKGHELFGRKFVPLTEFLPLKDYNTFLLTCGNLIMNNIRQQGMGNVIMSLWKGARVFINEKSPIYLYMKEEGVLLYKMSDLENMNILPDFETLAKHNRPILENLYNRNRVLNETSDLIKQIVNSKIA